MAEIDHWLLTPAMMVFEKHKAEVNITLIDARLAKLDEVHDLHLESVLLSSLLEIVDCDPDEGLEMIRSLLNYFLFNVQREVDLILQGKR